MPIDKEPLRALRDALSEIDQVVNRDPRLLIERLMRDALWTSTLAQAAGLSKRPFEVTGTHFVMQRPTGEKSARKLPLNKPSVVRIAGVVTEWIFYLDERLGIVHQPVPPADLDPLLRPRDIEKRFGRTDRAVESARRDGRIVGEQQTSGRWLYRTSQIMKCWPELNG